MERITDLCTGVRVSQMYAFHWVQRNEHDKIVRGTLFEDHRHTSPLH